MNIDSNTLKYNYNVKMTSFDQLSVELKTSTNVKIYIFKEKEFQRINIRKSLTLTISVTRLGDILDFGQLFKAFGNN